MNFNMQDFVTLDGDQLVTDSLLVAKHFKKQHRSVLHAIDNLDCGEEYRLHNFVHTVIERPNPSGGAPISSRMVRMTKNGFVWLAMGFRGKQAAAVKEAYIEAFDTMAESIERIVHNLWAQRMRL